MLTKGLLLHVGLPKTGTTSLQRGLFSHHSEICYLGKRVPSPIRKGCLNEAVYDLLEPALWRLDQPLELEKRKSLLNNQVLAGVAADRYLVGSWESLGNGKTSKLIGRLQCLRAIFGAVRIVFTLRNPLTQVPSNYLQSLRGNFKKRNRPWMGTAPFVELAEWFQMKVENRGEVAKVLCYSQNIATVIEILGRENVGVFLFEELQDDPDQYYRKLCEFIGIDVEEGVRISRNKHDHKRILQSQVEFLRKTNSSRLWKVLLQWVGEYGRTRLFERSGVATSVPAKVALPCELATVIADATRGGHRWLAREFDLPLERYGYPF